MNIGALSLALFGFDNPIMMSYLYNGGTYIKVHIGGRDTYASDRNATTRDKEIVNNFFGVTDMLMAKVIYRKSDRAIVLRVESEMINEVLHSMSEYATQIVLYPHAGIMRSSGVSRDIPYSLSNMPEILKTYLIPEIKDISNIRISKNRATSLTISARVNE